MRDLVHSLREDLLRAGLSPRHVERYLRELSEHRDDIADHLQKSGLSADVARSQADQRLGDIDALLLPMLTDRRFQSPAARWPALFYLVAPLGVQALLILAGILCLVLAATTGMRPAIAQLGDGLAMLLLAAPIVITWLTLFLARRRRASLRWPLLGAIAGATLAAGLDLVVMSPAASGAGQIGLTVGPPSLLALLVLVLLSLLPLPLHRHPE